MLRAPKRPPPRNNAGPAPRRRRQIAAALSIVFATVCSLGSPLPTVAAESFTVQATLILAGYDELTGALIVSVVLADKRPVTALSDANVGHKMQISTGGKRLMTSVLREPLRDGSFQMTSSSQAEVGALVAQLASGPATLVIDVAE